MDKQIKITKENLIKDIAKQTDGTIINTRNFYNTLENIIFDLLQSVSEEQDVYIKLFEGINLYGKYVPEKEKSNNLTGKISIVESKIKPKFSITRSYCEKLNQK